MKVSQLLSDYHANLINTFTRRQHPGRPQTWPTAKVVTILNDHFQVLLLQIIENEKRDGD